MEEEIKAFKNKQKSIRKVLIIVSIVLGVLIIFFSIAINMIGNGLSDYTNNTVIGEGQSPDNPIGGWVVLGESFGFIFQFMAIGGGMLIFIMLNFLLILAIALMWLIYGIYYVVKFNKIKSKKEMT